MMLTKSGQETIVVRTKSFANQISIIIPYISSIIQICISSVTNFLSKVLNERFDMLNSNVKMGGGADFRLSPWLNY